jgi:hypothetical protein
MVRGLLPGMVMVSMMVLVVVSITETPPLEQMT